MLADASNIFTINSSEDFEKKTLEVFVFRQNVAMFIKNI